MWTGLGPGSMRILILSQFYPPEPILRLGDLSRHLVDQGHDVRVVTALPTYPAGRLYDGYRRRPYLRSAEFGARVTRVASFPYRGVGVVGRLASYGSFSVTAAFALLFQPRPDVVYAYQPPTTVGLLAAAYCRFRRVPLVYDVQDLWPEAIAASGAIRGGRLDSSTANPRRTAGLWAGGEDSGAVGAHGIERLGQRRRAIACSSCAQLGQPGDLWVV